MVLVYLTQSRGEWEWIRPIVFGALQQNIRVHILIERPLSLTCDLIPSNDVEHLDRLQVKIESCTHLAFLDLFRQPWLRRYVRIIFKLLLTVSVPKLHCDYDQSSLILFKDLANDSNFRERYTLFLKQRFDVRTIIYPHGSEIFLEPFQATSKRFIADEIWCGSNDIAKCYRNMYDNLKVINVGVPRLYDEFIGSSAYKQDESVVLLVSRGINNMDMVREDFEECLKDVATVCRKLNKTLKIKHHPRYPKNEVSTILSTFESLNWIMDPLAKVEEYKYVLSMWSTLLVDLKMKGVNCAFLSYISRSTLDWHRDSLGSNISAYERNEWCAVVKSQTEINKFLMESKIEMEKKIKFNYTSVKELIKCELLQ